MEFLKTEHATQLASLKQKHEQELQIQAQKFKTKLEQQ
jgi:hypothetical protein